MGTRMADIEVGSEWAVGSEAIARAVRARAREPGFLERYGLDDDAFIYARGPKGPWESLLALLDPAQALARLIVLDGTDANIRDLWYGCYHVRVTVRAVRVAYRARMDGVGIGVTARGIPVDLVVHRSVLECEWPTWIVEREIGRAALVARRYARYDEELRRLLQDGS
jgi:hypothetical protein